MGYAVIFGLITLLTTTSAAHACERIDEKNGAPQLVHCPKDVGIFIDRVFMCQHFAGEINGDNSPRDKQVNKKLMKLKCDQLEIDHDRMITKYASDADVVQVIGKTIDDYPIHRY